MSVDDTPRLKLGQLADAQELDAMAINDALIQLDAFTDICLKGQFVNTPPSSPVDGDTWLLGAAPTGAWSGYAYKIAYCIDGGWRFYTPFDGLRALLLTSGAFLYYHGGSWSDFTPPPSGAESSVTAAATCDIGAAASLCVGISGNTTITSLGTAANCLRLLRFTGAPLLTYNATSLVTPTGANIQAAAGDCCWARSDGGGNWRIAGYQPAGGVVEASGAGVSVSTGGANVCSITLGPGRWRLSAQFYYNGSQTNNPYTEVSISTTSGGFASGTIPKTRLRTVNLASASIGGCSFAPFDVTLTTNTTYYLAAAQAVSTDLVNGVLRAERII